jgi:ABC-type molybdate transport system substrate-binding protein
MTGVRLLISISVCITIMAADLVRAEDRKLTVFAAGSLREALGAITDDFGAAHNIRIRTESARPGECASASSAASKPTSLRLLISVTPTPS